MTQGEYPKIEELKKRIKPFEELWKLQNLFTAKMHQWNNEALTQLNPDEVEADHKKMFSTSRTLQNRLEKVPQSIAQKINTQLANFRENIPIIRALCNPGLSQRHVKEIYALIKENQAEGQKITDLPLSRFLDLDIKEHKNELEEISDRASKEYSNQKTYDKMLDDWQPLEFTCIEVAGKDSRILSGEAIEAIQTILDDHIIKTQTMKGSPFAKFMLDKIVNWENVLMRT